jgi:hypothetical protein
MQTTTVFIVEWEHLKLICMKISVSNIEIILWIYEKIWY